MITRKATVGGRRRIIAGATALALSIGIAGFVPSSASAQREPYGKRFVDLQLLAFNDYHGHIESNTPGTVAGMQAGGAEYLSAKLSELREGNRHSLTVAAGDLIGGSPAVSGRLGLRLPGRGEVGLSYYGGYYNSYRIEGAPVDEARWAGITALDVGADVGPADLRAEVAFATIAVPEGLVELFGSRQWGGHVDVLLPVWSPRIEGYSNAVVTAGVRFEYVDYNAGTFSSTGRPIRDDVTAVVPSLSFRPSAGTVFRMNYRYHWTRDFPGNPAARMAGVQFGFAAYF